MSLKLKEEISNRLLLFISTIALFVNFPSQTFNQYPVCLLNRAINISVDHYIDGVRD